MESVKEEILPQHSKHRRLFPIKPSSFHHWKFNFPFASSRKKEERPFIIPTGFGLTFGTLATIQLVMAIASQNNLIYLFVFFEISIALASMFFTNSNVQKVRITDVSAQNCFAEEENPVEVHISEPSRNPSYQLSLRWKHQKEGQLLLTSTSQAQLFWTPQKRGDQKIPPIVIESTFPFGLLKAWKIKKIAKPILVYPHREGEANFPMGALGNQSVNNQGIFYDLKPFQKGDWPRRIDWRASQRSQQLLIRRFEEESSNNFHFHWNQTSHIKDFEKKISQLALWIDRAERGGSLYSLQIGKWTSGNGRGPSHWSTCLEKLARLTFEDCQ